MKRASLLIVMIIAIAVATVACGKKPEQTPTTTTNLEWIELLADGVAGIKETTRLQLKFDKNPTNITEANVIIVGATKGKLTGVGTSRYLAISNILVAEGAHVTVTLTNPVGFSITPKTLTCPIHRPVNAPTPPRYLSATGGDKRVTLSWTSPQSTGFATLEYYEVGISKIGETEFEWIQIPTEPTNYTFTDLENGQQYLFRLRAFNGFEYSSIVTARGTPFAPIQVEKPTIICPNPPCIEWQDVENANNYTVRVTKGAFETEYTCVHPEAFFYNIKFILAGANMFDAGTYQVSVRANASGAYSSSPYSDPVSMTFTKVNIAGASASIIDNYLTITPPTTVQTNIFKFRLFNEGNEMIILNHYTNYAGSFPDLSGFCDGDYDIYANNPLDLTQGELREYDIGIYYLQVIFGSATSNDMMLPSLLQALNWERD